MASASASSPSAIRSWPVVLTGVILLLVYAIHLAVFISSTTFYEWHADFLARWYPLVNGVLLLAMGTGIVLILANKRIGFTFYALGLVGVWSIKLFVPFFPRLDGLFSLMNSLWESTSEVAWPLFIGLTVLEMVFLLLLFKRTWKGQWQRK